MKGIVHFLTGVALATFFPEIVRAGAQSSLLPVLGGIGGILPDTLDFRFARYFEDYSTEIDPGPNPDPKAIVDALAGSMHKAYEAGRSQNVMLHTIRLGADLWREYAIRFDSQNQEVVVRIGPLVTTDQVPYPGMEPEGMAEARRKLGVPLADTYSAEYRVNIFSGPSFRFERTGDHLHIHFLDWHRRWSHSLALAAMVGALAGLAAGLAANWQIGLWAGLVAGLGVVGHILEDQLGYMGSNLLWPLTRKRVPGLRLIQSGDAIPNFLTVWTAAAMILFNLDRFSATPRLDPAGFLLATVALPLVTLGGLYTLRKVQSRSAQTSPEARRQADIVAEAEEPEIA